MKYMNEMQPDEQATVVYIEAPENIKRRFLDLGLVEGTNIKCVGVSPGADPRAYLIRGAVIAIRADDCRDIAVIEK